MLPRAPELSQDTPGGSNGKASAYNSRDLGSIPGSGRAPRERNGNPLQCSCLENPRDSGAWWAAVYGVAQSRIRLKLLSSSIMLSVVVLVILFNCFVSQK